jgi:hypothetical protein
MAIIPGVVTEDARKYWPQLIGTLFTPATTTNTGATEWDPRIKTFKVGEGGWIDPGPGREARTPDATLRRVTAPLIQDIDALVDPTRAPIDQRYPADSLGTFEKALTGTDFTFEAPTTIRIKCLLDFADFNDDGNGNDPEIFEIGIFCDHPTESGEKLMLAYATFPKQIKDNTKQLENVVRIVF